jgi:hypothetical protein
MNLISISLSMKLKASYLLYQRKLAGVYVKPDICFSLVRGFAFESYAGINPHPKL